MKRNSGYIRLYRDFRSWEWYKNCVVKAVYLECLLAAGYTPKMYNGINLSAGEFITGFSTLAEKCGCTLSQVRTAIKKLESRGYISVRSTNKYSIITLKDWDYQQHLEGENYYQQGLFEDEAVCESQTNRKQMTNKSQTNDKQIANKSQQTIKKKKEKKEKTWNKRGGARGPEPTYDLSLLEEIINSD